MSGKCWRPEELLPRADLMSYLLKLDKRVTGVAITGSLARLEAEVHDIDLVVLHDGNLENGSCADPTRKEPYYSNDLLLCSTLDPLLSRALTQARFGVPVDFIFVGERVLWDCEYLQLLKAKERFTDFYLRIFNDIPLILLNPYHVHVALQERFLDREKVFFLERGLPWAGFSYPGLYLRHQCDDSRCRPSQTWADCQEEIKHRKASAARKV